MSFGKTSTLSSGHKIPTLGYGTWQAKPGEVGAGVYEALKAGYRHLDLAKIYQNQPEVAQGIKQALAEVPGLKREDIFITSKLWNNRHQPDQVEAALDETLKELELDYLDVCMQAPQMATGRKTDVNRSSTSSTGLSLSPTAMPSSPVPPATTARSPSTRASP